MGRREERTEENRRNVFTKVDMREWRREQKRTEEKYLQRYICVSGEENREENRRGVFKKVHVRKWRREQNRRDVRRYMCISG